MVLKSVSETVPVLFSMELEAKPPRETSAENNRAKVLKSLTDQTPQPHPTILTTPLLDQRPPFIPVCLGSARVLLCWLMLSNVAPVVSAARLY